MIYNNTKTSQAIAVCEVFFVYPSLYIVAERYACGKDLIYYETIFQKAE